jgi:carbamate kinase
MNRLVIALGGNAIIPVGKDGTYDDQYQLTKEVMAQIADLSNEGNEIVMTHGNGPVVGNIMLRQDAGLKEHGIPAMPLFVCGADSQGGIGYMMQQVLQNSLLDKNITKSVAAIVTQVRVDKDDPGFNNPTKPIGPFYNKEEAELIHKEHGFALREDAGRGWRRVVASPKPLEVIEFPSISALMDAGVIVIAVGGGGIPVIYCEDNHLEGVDAVIDKDLASELLAELVQANILVIVTQVDKVCTGFGTPEEKELDSITVAQAKEMMENGEFPAGSMGPKIESAIKFIEQGGEKVLITDPYKLSDAIHGKAGTTITR